MAQIGTVWHRFQVSLRLDGALQKSTLAQKILLSNGTSVQKRKNLIPRSLNQARMRLFSFSHSIMKSCTREVAFNLISEEVAEGLDRGCLLFLRAD